MEAPVYHLDKVVKAKQEDMEDFDGPLDLILHLLSKNKIEIRDISISDLLDQYLAWMAQREELNLEVAMSEMEELMAALEEHKAQETYVKIKDVAGPLSGRYEFGRDYLTKQPEPVKADNSYRYVHDKGDILSALRAVLARTDNKLPPPAAAFEGIVGREPYPVADKARSILDRLVQFGVARFRALFKTSRSRSEVVATFLAILELCKANRIHLAGTAEDCTVTSTVDDGPGEIDVTVESY